MAQSFQHGHSNGRGGRDEVNKRFTGKQTTPDFGHLGGKVLPPIKTLLAAGPAAGQDFRRFLGQDGKG